MLCFIVKLRLGSGTQAHSGSLRLTQAHSGSDSGSVSQNNEHVPRNEISRKRIHSNSEETDGSLRKKIKDSREENAEFIAQAMECNYEGVDELRRELEKVLKQLNKRLNTWFQEVLKMNVSKRP